MFCSKCGTQLAEGANFCASCGTKTADGYEEAISNGNKHYKNREYEKALEEFSKALALRANDCFAIHWHGRSYYQLKKYDQAIEDLTKAIELRTEEDEFDYCYRGNSYRFKKDWDAVIKDFTKCMEIRVKKCENPWANNFNYSFYYRGIAYYELKKYDQAIEDFTKTIELNPDNANFYEWRGKAYSASGNEEAAKKDSEKAAQMQNKTQPAAVQEKPQAAKKEETASSNIFGDVSSIFGGAKAKAAFEEFIKPAPQNEPNPFWTGITKDGEKVNMFTDQRDGKQYRTVKIGDQVWMAKNLEYEAEGSRYYNDDEATFKAYGRLYDWHTAMEVCPKGWHLPSVSEWKELIEAVGGKEWSGKKLKANKGWKKSDKHDDNGTDEFGFWGLPGGYYDGLYKRFHGSYGCRSLGSIFDDKDFYLRLSFSGRWWSTKETYLRNKDEEGGLKFAYSFVLQDCTHGSSDFAGLEEDFKNSLLSIRCIKDK